MNAIELALEKQRLQLEIAAQRSALVQHATGLQPVFHGVDRACAALRWVGRYPEVVAGGVALLVAVRPGMRRSLWRVGQRGLLAWLLWPHRRKGGLLRCVGHE